MEIKVHLNNIRIAPRKTRQMIDVVRNKDVAEARAQLEFTVKRAANPVLKLLNSAVASAVNDFKLQEENLYISKITADEGPTLKRSFPMSRGRAYPIMKRTSHITLILSEKSQARNQKSETKQKNETNSETKIEDKKPARKRAVKKVTK